MNFLVKIFVNNHWDFCFELQRNLFNEFINALLLIFSLVMNDLEQSKIQSWSHLIFLIKLIKHQNLFFLFLIALVISHKDLRDLTADNWKEKNSKKHIENTNKSLVHIGTSNITVADSGNRCDCVIQRCGIYLIVIVFSELIFQYPVLIWDIPIVVDKIIVLWLDFWNEYPEACHWVSYDHEYDQVEEKFLNYAI